MAMPSTTTCLRGRLNGGPADGQVVELEQLQPILEQPEPQPSPGRPDPAVYRLRIWQDDLTGSRPVANAAGEVLYAYDWRADDSDGRTAIDDELDARAANPRPNSRGQRR